MNGRNVRERQVEPLSVDFSQNPEILTQEWSVFVSFNYVGYGAGASRVFRRATLREAPPETAPPDIVVAPTAGGAEFCYLTYMIYGF